MTERIFRYVVRYDGGSAPNPFGGWCSLAICKPQIRRTAKVGDWIIGLRAKRVDHVLYVMQVEERLSFAEYWNDRRFSTKRPDKSHCSDNIYRLDKQGKLVWVDNPVHDESHKEHDLGGQWVLVGREFWYFGDQSPQLPTDLVHLIHQRQGHSVHKNRKYTDIDDLKQWLWHWERGVHGKPIDGQSDLLSLMDETFSSKCCGTRKPR
jgi:hypothetical protein